MSNKNIVLYGCGSMAHRLIKILINRGIVPVAMVDSNPKKYGEEIKYDRYSWKIISYQELKKLYSYYSIVLSVSINYAIDIRNQLIEQGEKNEIIHMQLPFKVDDEFLSISKNIMRLKKVFSDNESKEIFEDFLKYKATGNMFELIKHYSGDGFFDRTILRRNSNDVFIDVGCYTGDTISQFLVFSDCGYNKIIGIEADPGNFKRAITFVNLSRLPNINIYNIGGWHEKNELIFHTLKNNNELNFDSPNFFKQASEIIDSNICSSRDDVYEDVKIQCNSLDNLFYNEKPTIIKINALAADYNILLGCRNIINEYSPELLIDYGARPEFIEKTVQFLLENRPDYKLFLRVKNIFGDYKTILYARM